MRHITLPARLAAILLLLVWVGPVTFAQTGSWELLKWVGAPGRASGESRVIPAGMAVEIRPGTPLELHLRDGSVVKGRFIERSLLDSTLYASRFAAKAQSSAYVPFALGETLTVSLRDGREWSGSFAGYAELALLLRGPDEPEHRRLPFESALEIRRATGDPVEPAALAREFRVGSLPSAEALVLSVLLQTPGPTGWQETRRVAAEDIEWVSMELPPAGSSAARSGLDGGSVAGIVLLSVVLSLGLVYVWLASGFNSGSCFNSSSVRTQAALRGLSLTTRPFDRDRGCYVGDDLAVADPGPEATVTGPTANLNDPGELPVAAPWTPGM